MNQLNSSPQPETLKCPNCGAEVEFQRGAETVRCQYCGSSVVVPEDLRPHTPNAVVLDLGTMLNQVQATNPLAESRIQTRQRRGSRLGCALIAGFILFMIAVTVVLPLTMASNAINSIQVPQIPVAGLEPTNQPAREPTRAPTAVPTPAFAHITSQFGSQGMGAGQFDNAHAGGIDGAGHIYVGEYTGGRIQVFDSAGKFINQFFVGDQHTDLLGFAVDRKGVVYIADGADITRYDGSTGKALGILKYSGGPGFGELALAPDGGLYAMWYERRNGIFTSVEGAREDLVRFDSGGKVVKVIKGVISSMTDNVELDNALAVDGRGNVYLAASFEAAIFKFDANGKFITRLGSSGEGSSQFGSLGAIAVDGQGRLFVVDSSDIKVLKPDGSLLDRIQVSGAARSLTFDDTGKLLVVTDDGVVKYQVNQK